MYCNWGWPGAFHFGGWMFWIILLFIAVAAFYALRSRKTGGYTTSCSECNGDVGPAYLRCPHCGATLKSHCPECSGIVESTWHYCPHCRAELGNDKIETE